MLGELIGTYGTSSYVVADGKRYRLADDSWNGAVRPKEGMRVEFDVEGDEAKHVFPSRRETASHRRLTAAILALTLGGLGMHKFILGYKGAGLTMLFLFLTGLITQGLLAQWMGIGIGASGTMVLIGLIEGLIYLSKTKERFAKTYTIGHRYWF